MHSISVTLIRELDRQRLAELAELYVEAEFTGADDDFAWLAAMLHGSMLCAGAFTEEGQLIGFARAVGDGVSDAYLQDVAVKQKCRGQGIGKRLVELLVNELRARGVEWIGLIATPGNAEFYRKLGFEAMESFTPMVAKRRQSVLQDV